jgi:hypothetical protein
LVGWKFLFFLVRIDFSLRLSKQSAIPLITRTAEIASDPPKFHYGKTWGLLLARLKSGILSGLPSSSL